MADTELYVTTIRTDKGDLPIDYNALANLPDLDTLQTEIDGKADSADLDAIKITLDSFKKDLDLKADSHDVAYFQSEVNSELALLPFQYVTQSSLESAGYVTETALAEQGYATETQLNEKGYVTETALSEKGYITQTQLTTNLVATDDTPGVVKPGEGLTVIDGTLHVDKHPLEDLSNIHVCDVAPNTSEIIDGHWYFIKAEV